MSDDLAFALELAALADSLSLPRFDAADLRTERKDDGTPVTDADRAVERALRDAIREARPGEAVLGEEDGGGDVATVRWIVDPIDGTRNFARGIPVWATLIALERDGATSCAVVSAPALGRRWWAAAGEGAFRDGERMRVSRTETLADASVSAAHGRDLALLEAAGAHGRGFGDFWQHVLVAQGSLDAAVDARLAVWDYPAPALVVTEAGGRASDIDGGRPRAGTQLVTSNAVLHEDVLRLLAP